MHRLIYVSTATPVFRDEDIERILSQARAHNERTEVTSLLLRMNNNFLQVLEGPRGAVEGLFRSISRDYRHGAVTTLIAKPAKVREYTEYAISYDELRETPDTEELFRLTRAALASSLTAAASLQSLKLLRTYIDADTQALAA